MKRAQSFIQYVVIVLIVAIALSAMARFFWGIFSSKQKEAADAFGTGERYDLINSNNPEDNLEKVNSGDLPTTRDKLIFDNL